MSEEIQNTAVSEEEQTEQDVHIPKKINGIKIIVSALVLVFNYIIFILGNV